MMASEGLLGLVLLTASVSWILSIYPVLEYRRSLAQTAALFCLGEVRATSKLAALPDSTLQELLLRLAAQTYPVGSQITSGLASP